MSPAAGAPVRDRATTAAKLAGFLLILVVALTAGYVVGRQFPAVPTPAPSGHTGEHGDHPDSPPGSQPTQQPT